MLGDTVMGGMSPLVDYRLKDLYGIDAAAPTGEELFRSALGTLMGSGISHLLAGGSSTQPGEKIDDVTDWNNHQEATKTQKMIDRQVEIHEKNAIITFEGEAWTGKPVLDYTPTTGIVLEVEPGKTTTVLGAYKKDTGNILAELGNIKSTDFGPRDGGLNLLNVPDGYNPATFWEDYNLPWLEQAVYRGDKIVLATPPENKYLYRENWDTHKMELSGFGKEYYYLLDHGYAYSGATGQMIKVDGGY